MKLAIMQPYLLPYIGYFQLLQAADKFVFYDDAGFIKQGWINRHAIALNGKRHICRLPIQKISSMRTIHDTLISEQPLDWQTKLLATYRHAYAKTPQFESVFPILEKILSATKSRKPSGLRGSFGQSIGNISIQSIVQIQNHLSISTPTVSSYGRYNNPNLRRADRVIDICRQEGATVYLNTIGGQRFFDKTYFEKHGIDLQFIKPNFPSYNQIRPPFLAGLSIVDVLMHNTPRQIHAMLSDFTRI